MNYFKREDSLIISEFLNKNHSIFGFHFTGNVGYVDSRGFLIINPEDNLTHKYETALPFKDRISKTDCINKKVLRSDRDNNLRDCCWICDGWRE